MPSPEQRRPSATEFSFRLPEPLGQEGTPAFVLQTELVYVEFCMESPEDLPALEKQAAHMIGQRVLEVGSRHQTFDNPFGPGTLHRWTVATIRETPGPWLAKQLWLAEVAGLRRAAALLTEWNDLGFADRLARHADKMAAAIGDLTNERRVYP